MREEPSYAGNLREHLPSKLLLYSSQTLKGRPNYQFLSFVARNACVLWRLLQLMIVSQVVAAVRAAFSPKHITFCIVEEVALNYYNVP